MTISDKSFNDLVREYAESEVDEKTKAAAIKIGFDEREIITTKKIIARRLLSKAVSGDVKSIQQVSNILGGTKEEVEKKLRDIMTKLYARITKKVLDPGMLNVLEEIFQEFYEKLEV